MHSCQTRCRACTGTRPRAFRFSGIPYSSCSSRCCASRGACAAAAASARPSRLASCVSTYFSLPPGPALSSVRFQHFTTHTQHSSEQTGAHHVSPCVTGPKRVCSWVYTTISLAPTRVGQHSSTLFDKAQHTLSSHVDATRQAADKRWMGCAHLWVQRLHLLHLLFHVRLH